MEAKQPNSVFNTLDRQEARLNELMGLSFMRSNLSIKCQKLYVYSVYIHGH